MFDDLDATLARLLTDAAAVPTLAGVDVTFKAPDKGFTPATASLDLFRYGVRENRVLRDPVPILEPVGGTYRRRTPPLRVDCDYLVTAWSKKVDATGVAEEGRILADALVKLGRHPTVPAAYLQGALVGQPFPVLVWVAQSEDSKSLGEFWSALGISPRASFHLTVTIAMDLGVSVAEGPPVAVSEIRLNGASTFTVGGTVRTATGAPIGAAVVTLDGDRPQTTGPDGRFLYTGLAAGTYALSATVPGLGPLNRQATVPGTAPDAYDLRVPP